jgi:uncharacterized membrane protein
VVRLLNVWDGLRGSFWFLPAVFAVAAVGVATALLALDRRATPQELGMAGWLYAGGAEGARSLLAAVAGSIITVVGLAFSITIVSLQLAAAQLGPRLLRNFVRDRGNQVVLGTFVATFVYCLVVLRTVRGQNGLEDDTFVPHLAVTGAVALALLSVALLIFFIHHAAKSIQADHVIDAVAGDLEDAIDDLFPERLGHEGPAEEAPPSLDSPADGAAVSAEASGYVISVDGKALLQAATEADVVVYLARRPGDFVIAGEPIARVVPGTRLDGRLEEAVADTVAVGPERTMIQDALFGVEQLVEIAMRALASNHIDPNTALRCIDRLGGALAQLSARRLPSPYRRDADGRVRVVAPPLSLGDVVVAAFTSIRLHGEGSRAVAVRLIETFARLAALHDRRDLHLALLGEAAKMVRAVPRAHHDPGDRAVVYQAFEQLLQALRPDVRTIYDAQAPAA